MKVIYSAKPIALIVFSGLSLVLPSANYAQAPAGPLPAAPAQPAPPSSPSAARPQEQTPQQKQKPRTVILGAWGLNRDESDDPRKKTQQARSSNAGSGGGYGGRRGGIGGGYPGGPRGGYGGRGGESDEERQKMQQLFTPANAITLSMTGAEVDLTDDQNRKRAFITDGRKLQKSKDANYQEIAAKWEGHRLVTEEKDPRGNKMSRTFELSSDGMELYETLHMTVGRNNTPLVIRYVYDQAPTSQPAIRSK
jgi:type IV secretory pathway VirB10-like protein